MSQNKSKVEKSIRPLITKKDKKNKKDSDFYQKKYDDLTDSLFGSKEKNIKPKEYKCILKDSSKEFFKFLINNSSWKGFQEAIQLTSLNDALVELYTSIDNIPNEMILNWNHVNLIYSYIKNVEGKGINDAVKYFSLMNDVSETMKEVLEDQQKHKDAALEYQASLNGISVEEYMKNINK